MITTKSNENIWETLQSHHHFEDLYFQFLTEGCTGFQQDTDTMDCNEADSTMNNSFGDSDTEYSEAIPTASGEQNNLHSGNEKNVDVNSFRFNFPLRYDELVESKVYPPGLMWGIRRYDKIKDYTIQRCGPSRASCLICHCEMNGLRISKHMLIGHAMGQRHINASKSETVLEMLQFYHNFWLNQEPLVQTHQVYFRPYSIPTFRCALCLEIVHAEGVVSHIFSDTHKDYVIRNYNKRDRKEYYLIELQLQLYGIKTEKQNEDDKQNKEENNKTKKEAKEKIKKKQYTDSKIPPRRKSASSKELTAEHKIIRSIERPESTDVFDHIPNRMKEQRKYLTRKSLPDGSAVVSCSLCKIDLKNDLKIVRNHISLASPAHVDLNEIYKYYCEICNIWEQGEMGWSRHNFKSKRHLNMAESRKPNVTEYECTTCKTVIFGDELSLARHLPKDGRSKKERSNQLPDGVKLLFKSKQDLLAEGANLVAQAEEVLTIPDTRVCCEKLEEALREQFENCKVYPFGSRISGIGTKSSDLDVFVDTGDMYYGQRNQDPSDQVTLIRKAIKAFAKNRDYENQHAVSTARTPILKLHYVPLNLDCDLSFKHGLSVENTKFLKYCLELQPIAQPFILLVKKWSSYILLECVNTYAFAVMCIFYLQVNGFLLSVERLRNLHNSNNLTIINGWKAITYSLSLEEIKKHIKIYPRSVDELLKEFFEYFSKFDFNSYVVCPLLGRVVNRSLFETNSGQDLPKEMNDYLVQLEGDDPEVFKLKSFMCVQDPFDLSHNLTKAVQQGTVKNFQNMCKLSAKHLAFN